MWVLQEKQDNLSPPKHVSQPSTQSVKHSFDTPPIPWPYFPFVHFAQVKVKVFAYYAGQILSWHVFVVGCL